MNIQLDWSMIACYMACPMKFYWRHCKHYAPVYKSKALSVGMLWHECMETRYNGEVEKAIQLSKQLPEVKLAYDKYCTVYDNNDFEPIVVESGFAVVLNEWLTYCGRVDLIGKLGDICLVDHKSTGVSSLQMYLSSFDISQQMSGYLYGANALCDEAISKIIMNIWHKRKNEFIRYATSRTDQQISDWKDDIIKVAARIVYSIENNYWYRHTGSCYQYFSQCPYYDVCQGLPLDTDRFEVKEWHPYKGEIA